MSSLDKSKQAIDYVRTFVPESLDTPELRSALASKLARLAEATGAPELEGLRPRFARLPPEDYANSWKKTWKPFRAGNFAVVPHGYAKALRAADRRLILEPGGAFGTGRHPTTRGALRAVEQRTQSGARILDAGCGNGILAVASALRGASFALGFDIDPAAIPYAVALAADNGVAGRCQWRAGGFECLGPEDSDFDGVCANLFADLIQAHAADLARRLKPGGWFAISGGRADLRQQTLAALADAGLALQELHTRGRWDTYAGVMLPRMIVPASRQSGWQQ